MPEHAATESLVRHAVLAPSALVRSAAADQLRYRPPHDYVPLLLSGLEAPIESWFHVTTDSGGNVHYRHSLYREGTEAKWSLNLRRSANQHDMQGRSFVRGRDGVVRDLGRHRESLAFVAVKTTTVAGRGVYGSTGWRRRSSSTRSVRQTKSLPAITNELPRCWRIRRAKNSAMIRKLGPTGGKTTTSITPTAKLPRTTTPTSTTAITTIACLKLFRRCRALPRARPCGPRPASEPIEIAGAGRLGAGARTWTRASWRTSR